MLVKGKVLNTIIVPDELLNDMDNATWIVGHGHYEMGLL